MGRVDGLIGEQGKFGKGVTSCFDVGMIARMLVPKKFE